MRNNRYIIICIFLSVIFKWNCSNKVKGTLDGDIVINIPHPDSVVTEIVEFTILDDTTSLERPTFYGGIDSLEKVFKHPDIARKAGIYGKTTLKFEINEEGQVENVVPIEYLTVITDELIEKLKKMKFSPANKNSRIIRIQLKISISYYLKTAISKNRE